MAHTESRSRGTALPLTGVDVVDLGTPTPGKYATFLLAEMGAAVLRVERPSDSTSKVSDEDRVLNRGKRSLTLNLRHPAGQAVLHRLAERADVLIESYRPGVAERLGADWQKLSEINPRLVHCSLSGFGHSGPDRSLPAYDLGFAGTSGLLSALFGVEAPPRVPEAYVADGASREESRRASRSPLYSIYETADGRYVTLTALRPSSLRALCREIGRDDLVESAAAGEADEELAIALREVFKTAVAEDWIARLRPLDVEIGRVNRPEEALADIQLRARGLVEEVAIDGGGARSMVTTPFRPTWGRGGEPARPAPLAGEHSDEVLCELGFEPAHIAELRRSGTI